MTEATLTQINAWRTDADADSPAGPLFSSRYTEAEIVDLDRRDTRCSLCTGSGTVQCC
jgi:hypothetical protein